MRWQVGVGLAILVAIALGIWAPSAIIERQMASVLRAHLEPEGSVRVRVRATVWGLAQQRVERMHVDATAIRLGDLAADRLRADLTGIAFLRSAEGWTPTRVRSGEATAEIGRLRLEQFLRDRGVAAPSVQVAASGVTVSGGMPAGAVRVPFKLQGQFEAAGRDLRFRVATLEVGGADVPRQLADTLMGLVQPVVSLSRLPIPLVVHRVSTEDGRLIVRARAEGQP